MKIDVTSLITILNKLRLYKEIEDKTILEIKSTISSLEEAYVSDNNLKSKNIELISKLEKSSNTKQGYIDYLENIINTYSEIDYNERIKYNSL